MEPVDNDRTQETNHKKCFQVFSQIIEMLFIEFLQKYVNALNYTNIKKYEFFAVEKSVKSNRYYKRNSFKVKTNPYILQNNSFSAVK